MASADATDDLSDDTPCHAKRVLAQPASNGTLISGSDRLWRMVEVFSERLRKVFAAHGLNPAPQTDQ